MSYFFSKGSVHPVLRDTKEGRGDRRANTLDNFIRGVMSFQGIVLLIFSSNHYLVKLEEVSESTVLLNKSYHDLSSF